MQFALSENSLSFHSIIIVEVRDFCQIVSELHKVWKLSIETQSGWNSLMRAAFQLSYLLNETISKLEPLASLSSDTPNAHNSIIFVLFIHELHLFEGRKSVLLSDFKLRK